MGRPTRTPAARSLPAARDLRRARWLSDLYCCGGLAIFWIVGLAIALPIENAPSIFPPSFGPAGADLWRQGNWREFIPHAIWFQYGVLLLCLGLILRRKVDAERVRVWTAPFS